jgi:hypothetical protein
VVRPRGHDSHTILGIGSSHEQGKSHAMERHVFQFVLCAYRTEQSQYKKCPFTSTKRLKKCIFARFIAPFLHAHHSSRVAHHPLSFIRCPYTHSFSICPSVPTTTAHSPPHTTPPSPALARTLIQHPSSHTNVDHYGVQPSVCDLVQSGGCMLINLCTKATTPHAHAPTCTHSHTSSLKARLSCERQLLLLLLSDKIKGARDSSLLCE